MSAPVERALEGPAPALRALVWGDDGLPPLLALDRKSVV